jgi:hypothetical protein
MPAQGVDQLGSLANQKIPRTKDDCRRLRFGALALHKPHRGSLRRFADRLCISHVVLLPLDERLHVSRRDKARVVPKLSNLASPVMGARTASHRTTHRGNCEKNAKPDRGATSCGIRRRTRIRAMNLKTDFARSIPTVLTSLTDASSVVLQHLHSGTSMRQGASTPSDNDAKADLFH